jgi:hypothetical protein
VVADQGFDGRDGSAGLKSLLEEVGKQVEHILIMDAGESRAFQEALAAGHTRHDRG